MNIIIEKFLIKVLHSYLIQIINRIIKNRNLLKLDFDQFLFDPSIYSKFLRINFTSYKNSKKPKDKEVEKKRKKKLQ